MNHPNRANKSYPGTRIEFARTPSTPKRERNNKKCTHTTNPRTHINTFCRQMSTNRELDAKPNEKKFISKNKRTNLQIQDRNIRSSSSRPKNAIPPNQTTTEPTSIKIQEPTQNS
ncbi:hypothetical protein EUGRSUZ_H02016 [Eucalyptus grandis]|uniref:Uncharacterized protein n=2 Tax=Eucalyptus grandis TaxID=71139 RepID=A0ACC3JQI7_EUCGR|nr:hypothetical protein EUGRSUZ_H02016 [Eucalyptus grandis]